MKLRVDKEHQRVSLTLQQSEQEPKVVYLPIQNIHYWYPFNINFAYKYSASKKFMYLIKEMGYTGENLYNVSNLKKSKPLQQIDGVPVHPKVLERNTYIIEKAKKLGLTTIVENFTKVDVDEGFRFIGVLIETVKNQAEDRLVKEKGGIHVLIPDQPIEEWDKEVYECMTKEEENALNEFGEMYTMYTLMRKIIEGK